MTNPPFREPGSATPPPPLPQTKPTPDQALALLNEGANRFASGQASRPHSTRDRVALAGQSDQADHAYATILGCSDSRIPVEIVFDAGVMDLFVVRVAGAICGPGQIGSLEYGVVHLKTPVVVVLGHTGCGAVTAAARAALNQPMDLAPNVTELAEAIRPTADTVIARETGLDEEALVDLIVEENVWQAVRDLLTASARVRDMARCGDVRVEGAVYDLVAGHVRWLPSGRSAEILAEVDADPRRAMF